MLFYLFIVAFMAAAAEADRCAPLLPPPWEFIRYAKNTGDYVHMATSVPSACFARSTNGAFLGIDKVLMRAFIDDINRWMNLTYSLSPPNWVYTCGAGGCGIFSKTRCDISIGGGPNTWNISGVRPCAF